MIRPIQANMTSPSFKGLIKDDKQAVNTKYIINMYESPNQSTKVNYALGNANYTATFNVPLDTCVKAYQKAAVSDAEVVDVRDVNKPEPKVQEQERPRIGFNK